MKVKYIKILSAFLLCVMLISSFSACSEQSDAPEGFQLVACEGDKFRLYVPTQGWSPNTESGTTSALFSADPVIAINVFVADDAGEMTVEDYWKYSESNFKKEFGEENYSFVGSEKATLGGQPAQKFVYEVKTDLFVKDEDDQIVTYRIMTILCSYKGEMYVFTYTAPAEERFDMHLEDVEGEGGILDYFRFDVPYSGEGKVYPDNVEIPEGMKLISTDERPYRFFVPEGWVTNNKADFSAAYYSSTDSSNVSLQYLILGSLEMDKTVEEYFAECEERYKKVFESYELLVVEDVTMDGVAAKKYTYTIVSGGVTYKQMQAIVERGSTMYVLTYTALPENFESHLGDVDKMIEHFDVR